MKNTMTTEKEMRATDFWDTKRLARMGLMLALSILGAFIKIPSFLGTPALDSAPGYFSAAAFSKREGAWVAALGHLVTALVVGFPLGLPIHLFISLQMAIFAAIFGYFSAKVNILVAVTVAVLLNTVVAPLMLVPILGWPVFYGLLLPLLVASTLNIFIAALLFVSIGKTNKRRAA